MQIALEGRTVDVFSISPRTREPLEYWRDIRDTIRLSHDSGFTGVLIFTGNDTYVDPWLTAQAVCTHSDRLSPLVAVNPVYMHPFSAAKMVSSLGYVYERKCYLNMVTGTAISHLTALADQLDHQARYDRLLEYAQIVRELLRQRRGVDFEGVYYAVQSLQLLPKLPAHLWPQFYIAGASEAARRVAVATDAVHMRMASDADANLSSAERPLRGMGVHLGLLVRDTVQSAWEACRQHFPDSEEGRIMQEMSMKNTDSQWKRQMFETADSSRNEREGLSLRPFRAFGADCPYYVGTVEGAGHLLSHYVRLGVQSFILDLRATDEDYGFVCKAFARARMNLAR